MPNHPSTSHAWQFCFRPSLIAFCRWQEERRKHFPTEENVAKKAATAKARAERGEIDSERQNKHQRLHSILRLQRNLGLAKAAGTDDIPLEDGAHDQGVTASAVPSILQCNRVITGVLKEQSHFKNLLLL